MVTEPSSPQTPARRAGEDARQLSAFTDFGPPSNAHACVFTSTDDTLLTGEATIGRDLSAPAARVNDTAFNVSHTCAAPEAPTTTSSTTTASTSATIPTTFGGAVGPASTSHLPGTGGDGGLPVAVLVCTFGAPVRSGVRTNQESWGRSRAGIARTVSG